MSDQKISTVNSALAGLAQAVSATMVGYPFDRVKATCQIHNCNSRTATNMILKKSGVGGLYRGVIAPLMSHLVKRPMQFTITETAKTKFPESGPLFNYAMGVFTGALGGAVATPFQVVKVGMQTSSDHLVTNSWEYIKHVWKLNRRLGDFWKGWKVCATKDMLFGGAFVGTYYTLRDYTKNQQVIHPVLMGGLNGAVAHAVSWACLIPVDYVKTQVLKASKAGTEIGPLQVVKSTIGQHGMAGSIPIFWKGVVPACVRTIPVSFVALAAFEAVRGLEN